MPLRQQRAARNRRPVTAAQPAEPPILVATASGGTGKTVFFQVRQYAQPPNSTPTTPALLLPGIPRVYRAADGTYPVSATLDVDNGGFRVTYAGADIINAETFYVGPYDPAMRTATGGWVGPGRSQVNID